MVVEPMRLRPCYKDYLWGGRRLKGEYGKEDGPQTIAESWELACHPDGNSVVAEGVYADRVLEDVVMNDTLNMLGSSCPSKKFPVLVKLIDAAQDLSIQVHPSDESALTEFGEQGKMEMWYIVDCQPQASIYYGFSERISRDGFFEKARDGSICKVLNRVSVSKGAVYYILPGMIHAIGKGIVIAEIQQNSNTTFRVYDYNRTGPNGNKRMLHLERAGDVLDYNPVIPEACRVNSGANFAGFNMKRMFSCEYFSAFCFDIKKSVSLCCDGTSFHHLLCVEGGGEIQANDNTYIFKKGDSYFMPAALGEYKISGECRLLLSRV